MLVISSREFRDNQKSYLDQVDEGLELLVQRGKNKSYRIVPVRESDTVISEEYISSPDADLERAMPFDEFKKRALEHVEELYKGEKA